MQNVQWGMALLNRLRARRSARDATCRGCLAEGRGKTKGELVKLHRILKKVAGGGMLVAALLLATPLDALACTQIYMGSDLTATGDTYVGRSEDFSTRYAKLFGVQEPMTNPTYISEESDFNYTYQGTTYRYTYVRDASAEWDGYGTPAPYSEAGTNEKGVSVSSTETTYTNPAVKAIDPYSSQGIGEFNIADVVLGQADTARDGVELLGSIIDQYGSDAANQIVIADSTETWIFMQLSGTQWCAILMPDDVISVNPNMGSLQFKVDLDDPAVCLHSEKLVETAQQAGTYTTYDDGTMNVAKSYGETSTASSRYVQGHLYFGDDMQEGVDYTVSNNRVASITDPLLMFSAGAANVPISLMTALRSFAARGEQSDSPAVNSNISGVTAIGSQRTTETHMFQIREGLSPDIATIEWIATSPAEFNVFLPVYGALLTEVDKTYYPDSKTLDVSHTGEDGMSDTQGSVINFIFMDINTLADGHRDTMAAGVRAYLDAMQESIIDQQEQVDAAMQALPEGEARNDLANRAFQAATEQLYAKSDALLDEMQAYINAGDFSQPFTPSDYDAENDAMVAPFAYVDSLEAPTITAHPNAATYKQGDNAAALTVGASAGYYNDNLAYQWYVADGNVSDAGDLSGFKPIEDATTASYVPATDTVGSKTYAVAVTNAGGLTSVSHTAVVTVEKPAAQNPDKDDDAQQPSNPDDTKKPGDTVKDPTRPNGDLPATGDTTPALIAAVAGVGALLVVGGTLVARRREQ